MSFSEWQEVTLADISIGKKGSYGIAAAAVEYSDDLLTYLRITDISDDGILNKDGLMSVDDQNAEKYLLEANDIVFARTGNSTGKSYFYDGRDGKLVYAGFLIKFSLDPEKVNPKFMRYYTISTVYKNWVNSFSTGSTRGNINAQTYGNMKINLPPRKQQNFLVDILSTLDEKIKVNNQINKTLESMSQEIFKHWFVDFEFPNEEGEPYRSSGGEMVESEIGMIPKEWDIQSLYDLAEYINGTSFKKDEMSEKKGLPIIKIAELKEGITNSTKYCISDKDEKYYLNNGDILFSWSGNPETSIDTFIWHRGDGILNQHIFKVTSTLYANEFIYLVLKYFKPIFMQTASNKQTTGLGHVTVSDLKRLKIALPNKEFVRDFSLKIKPIINKVHTIDLENNKLSDLRNTLLPRLMSGEIVVPLEFTEN